MSESVSAGRIIDGKYRIERVIGTGGMGVVVAARHLALEQEVAIKMLPPNSSKVTIKRCLREARAAARINSDHVVRIFDIGIHEGGAPYIVMELLNGQDLDTLLETHGPLPVDRAVDYLLQACEALAEAHAMGVVHRDIKPSNLFLAQRPGDTAQIKLLDFGISKEGLASSQPVTSLTHTNAVLGSPRFMSPEQLTSSRDVDEGADIWSLGATLHELLCGRPAFEAPTLAELCTTILRDPPIPLREVCPAAPAELEAVVHRCLEKKRERRYGSLAELVSALAPFAPSRPSPSAERIVIGVATTQAMHSPDDIECPPTEIPASDEKITQPRADEAVASTQPGSDQAETMQYERDEHGELQPASVPPPPQAQPQQDTGAGAWPVARRTAKPSAPPPPRRRADDEDTKTYVREPPDKS